MKRRFRIWKMRMMMRKLSSVIPEANLQPRMSPFLSLSPIPFKYMLTPPPYQSPPRTYTLSITYTPYYRTPRLYLSGYASPSVPLPPHQMLEDIVGDYKEKTVTLEDFPFFDSAVKMASVHPCKHASVMKVLLDRADAALKLRKAKMKRGEGVRGRSGGGVESGMEGLVDEMGGTSLEGGGKGRGEGFKSGVAAAGGAGGDEWEVLEEGAEEDEVAIRVDQYLVVFLKVSKTPSLS